MPRGRMITASLGSSRKFSELHAIAKRLTDFCQALYPLLVVNTDDYGRMDADAFTIKHRIFAVSRHSEADFAAGLQALHDADLIRLYEVNSKQYLQIVDFDPHQPGLKYRKKSTIP